MTPIFEAAILVLSAGLVAVAWKMRDDAKRYKAQADQLAEKTQRIIDELLTFQNEERPA